MRSGKQTFRDNIPDIYIADIATPIITIKEITPIRTERITPVSAPLPQDLALNGLSSFHTK
jgi:hypothetical protein